MTVTVSDATPNVLTANGTIGLQARIQQCPVAYTQASARATYVCPSDNTETDVRTASSLLSLTTAQPLTMISASLLAGATSHLKVTISLPDSTEKTLKGAGAGRIQSKSANLQWSIVATE